MPPLPLALALALAGRLFPIAETPHMYAPLPTRIPPPEGTPCAMFHRSWLEIGIALASLNVGAIRPSWNVPYSARTWRTKPVMVGRWPQLPRTGLNADTTSRRYGLLPSRNAPAAVAGGEAFLFFSGVYGAKHCRDQHQ